MNLFQESSKDLFRRRLIVKDSESDLLEHQNVKERLLKWGRIAKQSHVNNETALAKEMEETLAQMNDFVHRLKLMSLVHSNKKKNNRGKFRDWSKHQAFDHHFKDQLVLGHCLMGKMKELLNLEDTEFSPIKSLRSLSNKSYGPGMCKFIQESSGNISQCSRYSSEIKDVLCKLNRIIVNKETILPQHMQELEIIEEPKGIIHIPGSGRDGLKFLTDHLATNNIQPIFNLHPLKASESSYTVTCKVFNMAVEGKAPGRTAAKMTAAVKMLERLVDANLKKNLPPQITPLTQLEMKEAVSILCATEKYDIILMKLCLEQRKRAPHYETDFSKHSVHVRCSAFGLQSEGTHMNAIIAKRMAAWDILLQFKNRPKY